LFLLDTNVVSELRRNEPHRWVVAWLEAVPDRELFISAASIAQIRAGVKATRGHHPAKAREIEIWL
jgi:predicted nucleic acid-binding protein